MINESGCHYTNPNIPTYCNGYGECDISDWRNLGYKCKKIICEDDGIVGYKVCVPTTGDTTPKFLNVSNPDAPVEVAGHFEGNKCYSNTRSCSKFNVFINNDGGGAWTCKPEYQTGNATWVDEGDGMWNVSACKCESEAVVADGCAVGVVKHNRDDSYIIQKATDKIKYKQTHRYCQKCAAGKIPKRDSAETNGIKFRPDNPSGDYNWGAYRCENVSVPYYATGCTIDFTQSNFNNVVTGCQAQCSSQYLTITTNGATSADDCKPDSTEYTDGIGKFTLGPDSCN